MITDCIVRDWSEAQKENGFTFSRRYVEIRTDGDEPVELSGVAIVDVRAELLHKVYCCEKLLPLPAIHAGWYLLTCPLCKRNGLVVFYVEPRDGDGADGMWE